MGAFRRVILHEMASDRKPVSPDQKWTPGATYEVVLEVRSGDPRPISRSQLEAALRAHFKSPALFVKDWGYRGRDLVVVAGVAQTQAQQAALVPALVITAVAVAAALWALYRLAVEVREVVELVPAPAREGVAVGAAVGMGGAGVLAAALGLWLLLGRKR